MDILVETIQSLSVEEKKEFRAFIQRQRFRAPRKDLMLFDILDRTPALKAREICAKLYQPVNMNAYHTLRKRLTKHLLEFVVLKGMDVDTTAESAISGMQSMAKFVLVRGHHAIARKYLHKASELARSNEQYELLNQLLGIQIQHAEELQLDLTDLLPEWQRSKRLADEEQRVTLAYSLIRQKLRDVKLTGTPGELSAITGETLVEFGLTGNIQQRPSVLYKLAQITRSAVIASKSYWQFEDYVLEMFQQIERGSGFGKKDHLYRLWFLYMIAHVLYRNRKFDDAKEYLRRLGTQLHAFNGIYFPRFYPKYVLLKSAVDSYSGDNGSALRLLQDTLEDSKIRLLIPDKLNMTLNLAVYHFQAGDFRQANQLLHGLNHTDHWMEKKMGKEWRFKKNLIEIIIQVELGNSEIALNRIRSTERYFGTFLKTDMYQRAHIFMRFIRAVIEKPEIIPTPEFASHVNETIVRLPGDQEDIQAMTFYCWLKSKMLRRDYYPVLIETLEAFGKVSA